MWTVWQYIAAMTFTILGGAAGCLICRHPCRRIQRYIVQLAIQFPRLIPPTSIMDPNSLNELLATLDWDLPSSTYYQLLEQGQRQIAEAQRIGRLDANNLQMLGNSQIALLIFYGKHVKTTSPEIDLARNEIQILWDSSVLPFAGIYLASPPGSTAIFGFYLDCGFHILFSLQHISHDLHYLYKRYIGHMAFFGACLYDPKMGLHKLWRGRAHHMRTGGAAS